jgi:hypothetical protein
MSGGGVSGGNGLVDTGYDEHSPTFLPEASSDLTFTRRSKKPHFAVQLSIMLNQMEYPIIPISSTSNIQ